MRGFHSLPHDEKELGLRRLTQLFLFHELNRYHQHEYVTFRLEEDELGELNVSLTIHAANFQSPPNLQDLQPLHGDLPRRYLLERLAEVSPYNMLEA